MRFPESAVTSLAVRKWLTHKIFRICEDTHLAEDVASEVILQMFIQWTDGKLDFSSPGKLSYALKKARYSLRDHWLRRRFFKALRFDPAGHPALRGGEPTNLSDKTRKKYDETLGILRLYSTPLQFSRTVAFLEGETVSSIATREGVVKHAVSTSIDTAFLKFRKRLQLPLAGRKHIP